ERILFRLFFSLLLLLSFSPFCTYEPTSQIHPRDHGAEFVKLEYLSIPPHAVLGEDGTGAGAVDPNHQCHNGHGNSQHDQGQQRKENVLRAPAHPVEPLGAQYFFPVKPVFPAFRRCRIFFRKCTAACSSALFHLHFCLHFHPDRLHSFPLVCSKSPSFLSNLRKRKKGCFPQRFSRSESS